MYQSIQTEMRAAPASGRPRRPVEAIMGYDGPERRAPAPQLQPLLASITVPVVIGWLLRFWHLVGALALLGALAGLAAGTLIKPRFTSYSDMLLDPSNLQVMADDLYARNIQGDAQLLDVESKMRVLTSNNVLASVVHALNLQDDPDLMAPGFSLGGLFSSPQADEDRTTAAIRALGERVRVRREERSYVVTASVWAGNPERAAVLTDALVQAFLAELAKAEADGALSTSAALNERLNQLRDEAAAAETAVAAYRRNHGLQMGGDTQQLSAQSAVQLNTQIATAREALIAAQARYASLTGSTGESLANAAAQESQVLVGLRAQYAATRQQVDSLAATLGPRHPSLATASSQLTSLQNEIDREIARVVQTAEADLMRAQTVLDQLNQAAAAQRDEVFVDDTAQVELRQLERTAASKVAIYEAYLTRAQEITQRSQLDTTNVRVISSAVPAVSRNYPPRTVILVAGGLFAGLVVGLGLAVLAGFAGMALKRRKQV